MKTYKAKVSVVAEIVATIKEYDNGEVEIIEIHEIEEVEELENVRQLD